MGTFKNACMGLIIAGSSLGVDKNIDTQKNHEHIDDFLVRKSELLSRYVDDVDIQLDISLVVEKIYFI